MVKKNKITFALSFICVALILLFSLHFNTIVFAEGTSNTSSINGDFSSTSTENFPMQPKDWTVEYSSETNESIISGVIDVDETTYSQNFEKYGLTNTQNPGNSTATDMTYNENHVLMLNSGNTQSSFGYKSKEITFNADSYYKIYVDAFTTANTASIYLTGLINDSDLNNVNSFISIEDAGVWKTYIIFLKTSTVSTIGKIELWLGTKNNTAANGIAFFDNIDYKIISSSEYESGLKDNSLNSRKIDLTKNQNVISSSFNGDFESDLENSWNIIYGNDTDKDNATVKTVSVTNSNEFTEITSDDVKNDNSYLNENALLIYSDKLSSVGVESKEFTIRQHGMYRISVYAYAKLDSGTASIKLVESDAVKNINNRYSPITKEYTFSSNASSSQTNDYKLYSFYIIGNSFYDTSVTLQLWLGTSEVNAKGYVLYDDVTFRSLKYEDMITETKDNNILIDLSSNSSNLIANGLFNLTKNETELIYDNSNNIIYPLEALNWTYTKNNNLSDNYFSHGIVNINDNKYFTDFNPGTPFSNIVDTNNNILVLENKTSTYSSYSSDIFKITKDTQYKLELYVCTNLSNISNNNGATITLFDSSNNILATFSQINTNKLWSKYSIYINTGDSDKELYITLSLGLENEKSQGSVYFDNVIINKVSYTDSELLEKYTNLSETETWIDYSYNLFTSKGEKINDDYFIATAFKNNLNGDYSKSYGGIINYEDSSTKYKAALKLENLKANTNTFTSLYKFTFSSSKYYQVSVDVKTILKNVDEDFGAIIKLDNYSSKYFNFINTNGKTETYSFILKTDSTNVESNISFGLYSSSDNASGYVIFDNLKVEEITSAQYTAKGAENSSNLLDLTATDTEEDSSNNNTNNTDTDNNNTNSEENENQTTQRDATVWLYVTTIVTAVAVLVALIIVIFKKVNKKNKKRRNKKKIRRYVKVTPKNEIINHNLNKSEALNTIQKTNKQLENEINELKQKLVEEDEKYAKYLEEYKKSKENQENNETQQSETKLKKEIDTNKEFNEYIKNKNKILNEISKKEREIKANKTKKNIHKQTKITTKNNKINKD